MELSSILWQGLALLVLVGPVDPLMGCQWPEGFEQRFRDACDGMEVTFYDYAYPTDSDEYDSDGSSLWNRVIQSRRDYQRLRGSPRASDQERFPPGEVSKECWTFANAYVAYLERQSLLWPHRAEWYMDTIAEAKQLATIWKHAYYLNGGYGTTTVREHLREIRSLLGEDAYMTGRMPLPVPMWRFDYAVGVDK